jgi:glycosyltransferase involved in cell wall biosynthesis
VEDRATSRYLVPLVKCAARLPSDIVIGHGIHALPIAARAATRLSARLGFDVEDLHAGELVPGPATAHRIALIKSVERRYLPRCKYLIAASNGIADALVEEYGIVRPLVILNTFAPPSRPKPGPDKTSHVISLYWFSQVIGWGRGIETAVAALAQLPENVDLKLRGREDPAFVAHLRALSVSLGVAHRLTLLPPANPDDLIALAMDHDIGLALEIPPPRNLDLCVSNKILAYFAAGLAIAASRTRGQQEVMSIVPDAGFLYPPGDSRALAEGIRRLVTETGALATAKAAARKAALQRFSWTIESERLVAYLEGEGGASTKVDDRGPGRVASSSEAPAYSETT